MRHLIILWDEQLNLSAGAKKYKKASGNVVKQTFKQTDRQETNTLSRIKLAVPIQLGLNLGANLSLQIPDDGANTPFFALQGFAVADQTVRQRIKA